MMKKYGRTFHLPISPGVSSDDKIMPSLDSFKGRDIVITEKMDGENTTIHSQGCHARSPDSRYHPSRNWIKGFAAGISPFLAANERIVGENLYARHSVSYNALPSYFLGFAVIVDERILSWADTLKRFSELGIHPVPDLYHGPFSSNVFDRVADTLDCAHQEGFVARVCDPFLESDMPTHMGKYVRKGHVQSNIHWAKAELIPNKLKG